MLHTRCCPLRCGNTNLRQRLKSKHNSSPYSSFSTHRSFSYLHTSSRALYVTASQDKQREFLSCIPIGLSICWQPKYLTQPSPSRKSVEPKQKSINMPSLDTIPPEIFQEIGSYLAFFDKASLSLTSKSCRALLGPFDCPDYTSWTGYLCINAHCYPAYQQIYLIPELKHRKDVFQFLKHLYSRPRCEHRVLKRFESLEDQLHCHYSFIAKQEWRKDANVGGLRLEKPTNPRSSHRPLASLRPSPLLSDYFPGLKYPECTLAHFYMRHFGEILDAAESGSKQKQDLKGG